MHYLFLLFSLLIVSFSFGQNQKADSLSSFIENYQFEDTIKVNALNKLSKQYQWIDYYRSLQFAEQAQKLARALHYTEGIATAGNLKGFCYWAFGDNELAIEAGLEVCALVEEEQSPAILAESFLILSRAYLDFHEDRKARDYAEKAEKMLRGTKYWEELSSAYNWLGVIRFIDGDKEGALVYYGKALKIGQDHSIPRINIPRIISNIGECYLKNDRELAFTYLNNGLLVARETGNKTAEASISGIIGNALLADGDYPNAENYLQSSLKLSRKLGLRRSIRSAYSRLVDLRLKQDKAAEALGYLRNYYEVRDSLMSTLKTRQIVELEARLEIEKREKAIALLEQEKQIQSMWRNVLIVGVFLTLVAAFLIYRLQRSRTRKANQLLEVQQVLNEKLKEINKLNSRFFANVSHEFRTPLTLILAPIEELKKNRLLSTSEKDLLSLTARNANRLLELVNQLLDLSKLEAGKMEMKVKHGNINSFLEMIISSFDALAQQEQINFRKEICFAGQTVLFDQDKLEKIITNLLGNAFKFTAVHGAVTFKASMDSENNNNKGSLIITITDTGKGIPEEEQAHIFSPFYQTKQNKQSGYEGTGIGLSLVNELVKLYGGSISLQSEANIGTTFSVKLPVNKDAFSPDQIIEFYPEPSLIDSRRNQLRIKD